MNWRELGIENPNPDLISVVVLISMYIIRVISDLYCCSGLNCSRNLHLLNTILLILFKLGLFLHYLTAVICFWVSSNRELSWMETSWSTYSSSAFGICAASHVGGAKRVVSLIRESSWEQSPMLAIINHELQ
uniref:Uncharacterized protein n=2 Tax=Opuntia streptacantha TaxID=393608 RepID=A0A7C9FGM0_OPUST